MELKKRFDTEKFKHPYLMVARAHSIATAIRFPYVEYTVWSNASSRERDVAGHTALVSAQRI